MNTRILASLLFVAALILTPSLVFGADGSSSQSTTFMGISTQSSYYNSDGYASVYFYDRVQQGALGGRSFVLDNMDSNFYVNDDGTWNFYGWASFTMYKKKPQDPSVFDTNISSSQNLDLLGFDINISQYADNEWGWDPVLQKGYQTDDIYASFNVNLQSSSAVVYNAHSSVSTWHDDWNGLDYLRISSTADGHLPEPGTLILLASGSLLALHRRRR